MNQNNFIKGEFNFEEHKKDFISLLMESRSPGGIMENPFCPGEWLMKKPIPLTPIIDLIVGRD